MRREIRMATIGVSRALVGDPGQEVGFMRTLHTPHGEVRWLHRLGAPLVTVALVTGARLLAEAVVAKNVIEATWTSSAGSPRSGSSSPTS